MYYCIICNSFVYKKDVHKYISEDGRISINYNCNCIRKYTKKENNKFEDIAKNVEKIRKKIKIISNNKANYDKYENMCFEAILNDLQGIQGFFKSLLFKEKNKNKFKNENIK